MKVKLIIDGEEISLNEFVEKILSGILVGALNSLRGMKENWKEIDLKLKR